MKKTVSLLLALSLLLSSFCLFAYAAENGTDYTIIDPYAAVDWDTFDTYKANLHTHTTASDGDETVSDFVEAYYRAGYDILALTDHGVINYGWNKDRKTNGIFNGFKKVEPMSEEQYTRITTGADRGGRGMTDITGGIECNMAVVSKTHVNGYFTTWGQGVWGKDNDYKTAPAEIEKAGGYSVLNHVGDWVDSEHFPERSHDEKFIAYFADIFTSYPTCLGMEIVNNTDRVTKADRALWDELLSVVIPTGRNIWAFADDDSESLGDVGRSFELFPLAANTEENVKQAMIGGAFFAASRYDKTDPLHEFEGDGNVPLVTRIVTDQEADTITVEVDGERGCDKIEWIADGKVISEDYTLRLDDFDGELGCYVRFQLHSKGGVTYSQAFELRYGGRDDREVPSKWLPDNFAGDIARAYFQRLGFALLQLIAEKLMAWMHII